MKKNIQCFILIIISLQLSGCSAKQYQPDKSYETDIIGTYEINAKTDQDTEITYHKKYTFDKQNTYKYESYVFGAGFESNGNYNISQLTSDIIQINFDIINSSCTNEDSSGINSARQYNKEYKYKNMLGSIIKAEGIPKTKTFDYILPNERGGGMVFTKDGYYHACMDTDNCQCDLAKDTKYVRKDDIIYFDFGNNYWQICDYIVDDYLFTPELYKVEDE